MEVDKPPPKVSSSDDIQGYKRPEPPSRDSSSSKQRRPASIATSKPVRPNAPPPKPPPSRDNSKETSPEEIYIYDDASAVQRGRAAPLANSSESKEPIYDTIKEVPDGEDDEEFETPVGSPIFAKKPQDFDTKSTTSSGGEEDLMGAILKEVSVKSEGESIYSSLMRKDKKKRRRAPPAQD
jgi:hypothetical protein